MTVAETELLRKHIHGCPLLVEYGAGTSTLFALANGVQRIVSVETDPAWLEKLRGDPRIDDPRLTLIHADVGPVKAWGFPLNESDKQRWPAYARLPWPTETQATVLVDGRFRVASALTSALNTSKPILVHDYFNRPQYQAIETHLNLVDRVDNLAVFQGMRCNPNTVAEAIRQVEFIPD